MKRAIKIIVPLLLAIAILFSIGWYLFEYDPDFTRDVLLQQARRLEDSGNHSAAVWFYELAYNQSGDNDDVAIELAEKFKSIGNYTKAEYTLSKAIGDGGSVELYIALCKTFVEQDKLLDAVQMLDKVNNPEIKEQLNLLRPASPTASTESGFYSQYLSIELQAQEGTLYYSLSTDYPSIAKDAYTQAIPLSGGQTTIFALAVGENGLVSAPSIFSYTVGSVVEEVTFLDSAMEDAIRTQLQITEDRAIYSNELWGITEFSVPAGATILEDLKWIPYLQSLTIDSNVIDSLQALTSMQQLQTVTITDCAISRKDVQILAALPKLTRLTLSGCSLSTIADLEKATGLQYLDLSNNTIRDTSVLQGMTALQELYLAHNALVSLEDIATLTTLTALDVSYNSLATTAPLASLTALEKLSVSGNGLMNLEGVEALVNLQHFYAAHNSLVDVEVLGNCKKLEMLDISNNTLLNIDIIAELVKLRELNFSNNEVSALPAFSKDTPLFAIYGSYNQLTSLENLRGLSKLEYVYMDYNEGLKSISPLADCPALQVVNVYHTKVSSVSKLTDKGVVVNYDPT